MLLAVFSLNGFDGDRKSQEFAFNHRRPALLLFLETLGSYWWHSDAAAYLPIYINTFKLLYIAKSGGGGDNCCFKTSYYVKYKSKNVHQFIITKKF